METESQNKETPLNMTGWYGSIAGICLIVIASAVFITRSYLKNHKLKQENWRPGIIGRLEDDIRTVNHAGKETFLGELEDKIYLATYLYSDNPEASNPMTAELKKLLENYGDDPRFHIVSISIDSATDTSEELAAWVEANDIPTDRWWCLTGDKDHLRKYLLSNFPFYLPTERNDDSAIADQNRVVIVDGKAHLRGFYGLLHPVGGETAKKLLHRDLQMILDPTKKLKDFPKIEMPKTD